MFKTIIVPLDGSLFAEQAIGTAATIAQHAAAELVLVRVHEPYVFEATDYSLADDLSRRDQEQYLAEMAERVENLFGMVPERVLLDHDGQKIMLIDTAGIRRRGHVKGSIEKYSLMRAVRAMKGPWDVAYSSSSACIRR